MSVRCPDCGAIAGYGREIPHKSDCPMVVGVSAATAANLTRMRREAEQLKGDLALMAQHANALSDKYRAQIAIMRVALEQAQDCIRGETPEDCTPAEAREDTLRKVREALGL